jgi:hypothetical protein
MKRVAVALLLATVAAPAHAVLCRTKKANVFERAACRKRETVVDLAAAGIALPGEPGAKGASQPRLRAVDADGKSIGFVNGSGDILFVGGGRGLYVQANADGFPRSVALFFDATGCTGPPHVIARDTVVYRAGVLDGAAIVAGDPIQTHAFKSESFSTSRSICTSQNGTYDASTGVCCEPTSLTIAGGPATRVELGAFRPPFRIEIER